MSNAQYIFMLLENMIIFNDSITRVVETNQFP